MYSYSNTLKPDAPFVPIDISSVTTPKKVYKRDALVDTGAGVTGIPLSIVSDLNLKPIRYQILGSATGKEKKPIYTVNITFHGLSFANISVVLFDQRDFILLGRDIINAFHLCLDGSKKITKVI